MIAAAAFAGMVAAADHPPGRADRGRVVVELRGDARVADLARAERAGLHDEDPDAERPHLGHARAAREATRAQRRTAAASAVIWSGPTRQQPPISRAPARSQPATRSAVNVAAPRQPRARASQDSPLFG